MKRNALAVLVLLLAGCLPGFDKEDESSGAGGGASSSHATGTSGQGGATSASNGAGTGTGSTGSNMHSTGPGSTGAGTGSTGTGGGCVPSAEICDGIDNNCDGQVDEGCPCQGGSTQACYSGPMGTRNVGECKDGFQECFQGVWGPCQKQITPEPEFCDGKDNDCNGMTDDLPDNNCGVGACATTAPACKNGAENMCTPLLAGVEICDNGIDDDCDGVVDNGCCDDLAPTATATATQGGVGFQYGPAKINDNVGQTFCFYSYIYTNAQGGAFWQLVWQSSQTIESMFIDSEDHTMPACAYNEDLEGGTVQYLDANNAWKDAGQLTCTGGNCKFDFPSAITTTGLRIANPTAVAGVALMFEWYVYKGTGCAVPNGS